MGKDIIRTLQEEHTLKYELYSNFCEEIEHQLIHLIRNENIKLAVPIQYRAKSWISIYDKIDQKRFTIKKSITELQDLAGIRMILLFSRDVKRIIELIQLNFKVIKKYNIEEKLSDDQFGYSSTHIIIELLNDWLKIPTLSKFKGMKIEFQVRTLSQHSWAEVSNFLQYKQENNVPKPLKRSISRISALLETVDLEYERLLSERDSYKIELKEENIEISDASLNVDLLENLLDTHLPASNKIEGENYSDLLKDLEQLKFYSSNDLINLIENNKDYVFDLDKKVAKNILENYKRTKKLSTDGYTSVNEDLNRIVSGMFFSHTGLIREMLEKQLGAPLYKLLS